MKDAVQRDDLVTFDEMHPSLAKLPSQERAALAYAQVAMAVEYLVQQRGPRSLAAVLTASGRGSRPRSRSPTRTAEPSTASSPAGGATWPRGRCRAAGITS